jgi:hypothetical protein
MKSFTHPCLIAAFALTFGAMNLSAAEPQPEDSAFSAKLITAIETADYAAFVADGDDAFKQMKKEQFDAVAAQLGPKFKGKNEFSFLGELKQKGYRVTLWKVTFKDGGDDALVTLSVKGGKVGGFFVK